MRSIERVLLGRLRREERSDRVVVARVAAIGENYGMGERAESGF